jgi:exosortase/archaeosortase family protein
MTRQQWSFLVRFACSVGGFVVLFHLAPEPFARMYLLPITWTAALALNLLGMQAVIDVSSLADGFCMLETEFTLLRVEFECTGLFSLFVYLGAVLAYPVGIKRRAIGIAAGLPAFFLYSVLRLTVIGIIDQIVPWWLDWFHIYLMVLLNLGYFLFLWSIWVNRCAIRQQTA